MSEFGKYDLHGAFFAFKPETPTLKRLKTSESGKKGRRPRPMSVAHTSKGILENDKKEKLIV